MGETAILDREARLAVEVTFEPRRKGCHELRKETEQRFSFQVGSREYTKLSR